MLPSLRQRLMIAAALVAAAVTWGLLVDVLRPADLGSGLVLTAAQCGPMKAVGWVLLAGLAPLLLGAFTSAQGNPLTGVFAVTAGLITLAAVGGPIDGWLWRAAEAPGEPSWTHGFTAALPGAYYWLMLEMVVWQAAIVLMLVAVQYMREPLRRCWPALAFNEHLGEEVRVRLPQLQALSAGATCAVVAGVLSYLMIRSSDSGQVIVALVVAFAVGGLVGQMSFPQTNPAGILLAPAVVAMASYAFMAMRFDDGGQVMWAWFSRAVPGTAMALPIHYASAGLAGCCLGVGWAQTFSASEPLQASSAGPK